MSKKAFQRIKMRVLRHAVKHDGIILEYGPDHNWFIVEFDGPIPNTKFYQHSLNLVTDREPYNSINGITTRHHPDATFWEVL